MTDILPPLTLANALAALVIVSLTLYVLFGGADFGGGVWDWLASGPRARQQRTLITDAIGPIWEANHVWLILVVVLLFTGFPKAYAAVSVTLHIPLTLMLVGIVLRGSAFTFRTYDTRRASAGRRWGRPFALASIVTPVLLGMCVGAIASGEVGKPVAGRSFADAYVWSWLSPFTVACGLLSLSVFAYLAALYLWVEAKGPGLRADFRRRAAYAAGAVFATGASALATAWYDAPAIIAGLVASRWAIALHVATGACALTALWALWRGRWARLARVAGAAQVVGMLFGWYASMYPYVIPNTLTIEATAAPPATLRLVLGACALGTVVLLPSLWYLLRIFKGAGSAFERLEKATGEYEVLRQTIEQAVPRPR